MDCCVKGQRLWPKKNKIKHPVVVQLECIIYATGILSTQQFAVPVLWMEPPTHPTGFLCGSQLIFYIAQQWSIKKLASKVAAAAKSSNGWVYCGILLLFVCPELKEYCFRAEQFYEYFYLTSKMLVGLSGSELRCHGCGILSSARASVPQGRSPW